MTDVNSFQLLAIARTQARRAGMSADKIASYLADATSGDRDHLEDTCIKWACELEEMSICAHNFIINPQSRYKRCAKCGTNKKD